MKKSILSLVLAMFLTSLFAQVPQYQRRQVASQWFMRDVKVGGTLTAGKYVTPTDTVALYSDLKKKLSVADTASLVATKSDLSKLPTGGVSQMQFDTTLYTPVAPPSLLAPSKFKDGIFYVVQPSDSNYINNLNQWYQDGGGAPPMIWNDAMSNKSYVVNGIQYRLPTKQELNLLYNEKTLMGITDSILWSSTVATDTNKVWVQNFATGSQYELSKDSLAVGYSCALVSNSVKEPKYATASSLSNYATTSSLSNYATTSSLNNYATISSLSNYATTSSLSNYATIASLNVVTSSLSNYATTSSLSDYATIASLNNYVTTVSLGQLNLTATSFNLHSSGGTSLFVVTSDSKTIAAEYTLSALNTAPVSATDTGTTGEIRVCADYIYVCTATNTWVRAALSTW